jgi:hypothetical protein
MIFHNQLWADNKEYEFVSKFVSSFGTLQFSTQTAELFILPVWPEHWFSSLTEEWKHSHRPWAASRCDVWLMGVRKALLGRVEIGRQGSKTEQRERLQHHRLSIRVLIYRLTAYASVCQPEGREATLACSRNKDLDDAVATHVLIFTAFNSVHRFMFLTPTVFTSNIWGRETKPPS